MVAASIVERIPLQPREKEQWEIEWREFIKQHRERIGRPVYSDLMQARVAAQQKESEDPFAEFAAATAATAGKQKVFGSFSSPCLVYLLRARLTILELNHAMCCVSFLVGRCRACS